MSEEAARLCNHGGVKSSSPIFLQIADDLREKIRTGIYPVGSALPTESALAAEYGVSVGTVRQSLKALVGEGILNARRGARKVVMRLPVPSAGFDHFRSFAQWVHATGRLPGGRVVEQRWEPATAFDQRLLRLSSSQHVLYVLRVRSIDGAPAMVERTRYAEHVGKEVEKLAENVASVTNALRGSNIEFASADHIVTVCSASGIDTELLGVPEGEPLLKHRRVSRDETGTPLEWSEDRYVGGAITLAASNMAGNNSLSWATSDDFPWVT